MQGLRRVGVDEDPAPMTPGPEPCSIVPERYADREDCLPILPGLSRIGGFEPGRGGFPSPADHTFRELGARDIAVAVGRAVSQASTAAMKKISRAAKLV